MQGSDVARLYIPSLHHFATTHSWLSRFFTAIATSPRCVRKVSFSVSLLTYVNEYVLVSRMYMYRQLTQFLLHIVFLKHHVPRGTLTTRVTGDLALSVTSANDLHKHLIR